MMASGCRRSGPSRTARPARRATRAVTPGGRTLSLVGVVLVLEEFPGGHADDAGFDAFGGELLVGVDAERDFAAGGEQEDVGLAVGRRRQDVGAAMRRSRRGRTLSRSSVGRAWRVRTRTAGSWRRFMMTRQASATSLASAGRSTIRPGMARRAASCSMGWWVGPSSPTPMESWVKTWMAGISMMALEADRGPPVVAEDQEAGAEGRAPWTSDRPFTMADMACSRMPKWKLRPAVAVRLEIARAVERQAGLGARAQGPPRRR